VDLHPGRRFDNPYCRADYESQHYEIAFGGRTLKLDFSRGTRSAG
jgi:hypothetical protein